MNKTFKIDSIEYTLRKAYDGVYELWVDGKFTNGSNSLDNISSVLFRVLLTNSPLELTVETIVDYYRVVVLVVEQFAQEINNV